MEALNLMLGFYMFFLWYLEKLTTVYIAYIYVTKTEGVFSFNCKSYYIHIVLDLGEKKLEGKSYQQQKDHHS